MKAERSQGELPTLHQFLPNMTWVDRPSSSSTPGRKNVTTNFSDIEPLARETTPSKASPPKPNKVSASWQRCWGSLKNSTFSQSSNSIVKYFGVEVRKKTRSWFYGLSSIKILAFVVALCCSFSFASEETLANIVPVICFIVSLMAMLVSSATILMNYRYLDQFKIWSLVLQEHCSELYTQTAEEKFCNRWHVPFIVMFSSLVVFLSSLPLVSRIFLGITFPVFVIASILGLFCSIRQTGFSPHIAMILFFAARSPGFLRYSNNQFTEIVPAEVKQHLHFLADINTDIEIANGVHLKLNINSVCHMMWLLFMIGFLLTKGFLSVFTVLLSITWLNLSFLCLESAFSPLVLGYCSLVWVTFIFAPLLANFIKFFLPVLGYLILCLHFGVDQEIIAGTLLTFIAVQIILQKYFPNAYNISGKVVLFAVAVCLFLGTSQKSRMDRTADFKWDSYRNICVPSRAADISTFLTCKSLQGMHVRWQGEVADIEVSSSWNWLEKTVNVISFPESVHDFITCSFGEKLPPCTLSKMSAREYETCVIVSKVLGKETCSLRNWDFLTFTVSVAMESSNWKLGRQGMTVDVIFDNTFTEEVRSLKAGDSIEFHGILAQGVGTKSLKIIGSSLNCPKCPKSQTEKPDIIRKNAQFFVQSAVSSVFQFFLTPTIVVL